MTEAELVKIEARHAHDGGMVQWAPTVDVRKLAAEVRRLQELVKVPQEFTVNGVTRWYLPMEADG